MLARSRSLKDVGLTDNEVSDEGAATLAGWKGLERLDLSYNRIADRGFKALAGAAWAHEVRSLELGHNRASERGVDAFARRAAFSRLERLSMANMMISVEAMEDLAGSGWFGALHVLDITSTQLDQEALAALTVKVREASWRELVIACNPLIGSEGFARLVRAPCMAGVRRLDARECGVGDAGAVALGEASLPALHTIDLRGNGLGANAAHAMLDGVGLGGLRVAFLDALSFDRASVEAMRHTRAGRALHFLDVSGWHEGQ